MNKKTWAYLLSLLLVIAVLAWFAVLARPSANLRIIACDVGQGDAILVTQGSIQILVDGGPNNKVLSCLSRHIPFWDRKIEAVVMTHPDADHSTGLVEVFRNYKVANFVTSEVNRETSVYSTLKEEVIRSGAEVVFAQKGERITIGAMGFDILHPTNAMLTAVDGYREKVLGSATSEHANDFSVVMKLSYGQFDALLTGDIEDKMSDLLAESFDLSGIEYLKVPHHGSKNGLSQKLFDELAPRIAVISLGKNSYGHPHQEVMQMLKNSEAKVLRTDESGDVIVESDGANFKVIQ